MPIAYTQVSHLRPAASQAHRGGTNSNAGSTAPKSTVGYQPSALAIFFGVRSPAVGNDFTGCAW